MAKKNIQTKDQIIANLLRSKTPYEKIKSIAQCGNSRISRISSLLKNNEPIISAKLGRPPKVTPQIVSTIEDQTIHDPTIGGSSLSSLIATNLGIDISPTTINQIRNQLKFQYKQPRRRPFMTEQHIQTRLNFCNTQLQNNINWEDGVIFSDESRFCLRDDSRRIWIKRGVYNDATFINEKKYDIGLMVWGAIGVGWRSPLILVKGRLNSDGYISMLENFEIFQSLNKFYGEKNFIFEQDGAPAHRSKKTLDFIQKQQINIIENWPANSPDLSCIEQVWSILEVKIRKYSITSLNQLYECLQKEWYSIPQKKLDSLISKTKDRFKLCIEENGKAIGHKLYTLNKQENINLQEIFSQDNNDVNSNLSPILQLPLQNTKDFDFCKLIANKVLENENLPYLLKIDNINDALHNYGDVIKHHVSVPLLINNLANNIYNSPNDFFDDLNQMWRNMEIFHGKNSEVVQRAKILEDDILLAWNSI